MKSSFKKVYSRYGVLFKQNEVHHSWMLNDFLEQDHTLTSINQTLHQVIRLCYRIWPFKGSWYGSHEDQADSSVHNGIYRGFHWPFAMDVACILLRTPCPVPLNIAYVQLLRPVFQGFVLLSWLEGTRSFYNTNPPYIWYEKCSRLILSEINIYCQYIILTIWKHDTFCWMTITYIEKKW